LTKTRAMMRSKGASIVTAAAAGAEASAVPAASDGLGGDRRGSRPGRDEEKEAGDA